MLSPKCGRVIKAPKVNGVVFCVARNNDLEGSANKNEEEESLKALEAFWYDKGLKEGHDSGFENGINEGEGNGYKRGLSEGAEKGYAEGCREGYDEGMKNGGEKARTDLQDAIMQFKKISSCLSEEKDGLLDSLKRDVIDFALIASEKIIRRDLRDRELLVAIIEEMLVQARPIIKNEPVRIFLSSEDFTVLEKHFEDINYDKNEIKKLQFFVDNSIRQGDCQVRTSLGLINFDVARQLEDVKETAISNVEG